MEKSNRKSWGRAGEGCSGASSPGHCSCGGWVSPSGHGELSRFRGGTSLLSGPGGSPRSRLSLCKRLVPESGQIALPRIPCRNGSSQRKRLKRKLSKAYRAFVSGRPDLLVLLQLHLQQSCSSGSGFCEVEGPTDALECNFRVPVSITAKPGDLGAAGTQPRGQGCLQALPLKQTQGFVQLLPFS